MGSATSTWVLLRQRAYSKLGDGSKALLREMLDVHSYEQAPLPGDLSQLGWLCGRTDAPSHIQRKLDPLIAAGFVVESEEGLTPVINPDGRQRRTTAGATARRSPKEPEGRRKVPEGPRKVPEGLRKPDSSSDAELGTPNFPQSRPVQTSLKEPAAVVIPERMQPMFDLLGDLPACQTKPANLLAGLQRFEAGRDGLVRWGAVAEEIRRWQAGSSARPIRNLLTTAANWVERDWPKHRGQAQHARPVPSKPRIDEQFALRREGAR